MLGLHCIEVVPGEVASVQYRMAMGRLLNAGWEVTALAAQRSHDTRTLRLWGEALLCPDPAEMLGRLSGRADSGLDGLPLTAPAEPEVASCAAADPRTGADGCVESTLATGGAIRAESEAGSSAETQALADPQGSAVALVDAPADGAEAHSDGGSPATPCASS
jgi:hypothetical protein